MYHLFVSADEEAWDGTPYTLDRARCIKESEYSSASLVRKYGEFCEDVIDDLLRIPAIFAYENSCGKHARFGRVTRILSNAREVRLEYELIEHYPPIPNQVIQEHDWEFGISGYELSRTHWALKKEDLGNALRLAGFPEILAISETLVNIHEHNFDVALSFPGEVRDLVEVVANRLTSSLGSHRVFYDNFYKAQLAVPNLDLALQKLYRHRSRLIVAFLSDDYERKPWCGIEFRAIREIINSRDDLRVMFIRINDGEVNGVFSHDGYIDSRQHSPQEIANLIFERNLLLQPKQT